MHLTPGRQVCHPTAECLGGVLMLFSSVSILNEVTTLIGEENPVQRIVQDSTSSLGYVMRPFI